MLTSAARRTGGIVVAHPARQHSYETVMAAQSEGLLQRFDTGFYWRHDASLADGAWRRVPAPVRGWLRTTLRRRWHPELDPSLVATAPVYPAIAKALTAAGRLVPMLPAGRVHDWTDMAFDVHVSQQVRKPPLPSIVHAFEGFGVRTLTAAREIGAAAVLDVPSAHEYFLQVSRAEGEAFDPSRQARQTAQVQLERQAADWLLVASEYARTCLLEAGVPASKIVLLPYGANPERFHVRPSDDFAAGRFRVLCVGQVIARKGVGYLLDAWQQLDAADAELVLAGGANSFGLNVLESHPARFRWLGNVPSPLVHELFETSEVFVSPSLSETGPLVVYEAMASGLPVITTENARAVVRDGVDGFVVPIRDSAAIADRLRWLYQHPRERQAMGVAGRQRILQSFTWRHYRARLGRVYRAIQSGERVQTAVNELEANGPRCMCAGGTS